MLNLQKQTLKKQDIYHCIGARVETRRTFKLWVKLHSPTEVRYSIFMRPASKPRPKVTFTVAAL